MMNTTDIPAVANKTLGEDSPSGVKNSAVVAITCMLSFFFVIGTVGNALAFIIYYRKREKGTSTIFIISLTVTDFLTCLIAIPYTITHELMAYKYSFDIFCRMYNFIITFNIPLSSLILVVIGFDRYFCICHPFLHVFTVPRAKIVIFILTIISVSLGIVPFLAHSIYYIQTTTRNFTVPLNNTPSIMINQLSPETSSQSFTLLPSVTPAVDYLTKITTDSSSSSTQMFTEGLFLNPDQNFLDEMEHGDNIAYKTGYTSSSQSTSSILDKANMKSDTNSGLNYTIIQVNRSEVIEIGRCVLSQVTVRIQLVMGYQRVYASIFLVEFIVLAILYGLIYRSILVRRAWKAKRKQKSSYSAPSCVEGEETQLTCINGNNTDVAVIKKNPSRISAAMRDKTFYANIRTAAMLFVVTAVFVLSFLPSWLMGLRAINFNLIVFYMFYLNNVANPIIYAFMNRTFRDELVLLIKNCFCRR